jgi:endonuclease G
VVKITYPGSGLRPIRSVMNIVPLGGGSEVSEPGDSGSLWVDEETHAAVGLHFAGSDDPETALAIDMAQVLKALHVTVA